MAVFALPNRARTHVRRRKPKTQRSGRRTSAEPQRPRALARSRAAPAVDAGRGSSSAACRSASYPVDADATPRAASARLAGRQGHSASARTRTARTRCRRTTPTTRSTASSTCRRSSPARAGIARVPDRHAAPQADPARPTRQMRPTNARGAAGRHAARGRAARSSTSSTSCARTAPTTRSSATTPRGDGDPKLTLFGDEHHAQRARARQALPAARPRLRELRGVDRRPLLDGGRRRLRLRRTRTGTRTTPAAGALRLRRLRGHLAGASGFLFDQAEKQGISYFNYGEAVAGVVPASPTRTGRRRDRRQVDQRSSPSPTSAPPRRALLPERRLDRQGRRSPGSEVYDSSLPRGRAAGAESRFDCFRPHFTAAGRDAAPCRRSTTWCCPTTTPTGSRRAAARRARWSPRTTTRSARSST